MSDVQRMRQVLVLGTGGTIAGAAADAADALGYRAGQIGVQQLLGGIAVPGVALQAAQVANIDSKDMDLAVWQALVRRLVQALAQDGLDGIVVTHGTDTLEETAFFLHSVLPAGKPLVLTCAMRPATALAPDGPQNLRDAVAVAATPGATGVLAVCAARVHGGAALRKQHTYRLDAFSSGDEGLLGDMEEGRLRRLRDWPQPPASATEARRQKVLAAPALPRVEILGNHAGADGRLIDLLLRERASGSEDAVQGLVLAGTGNGTLSQPLEAAALRAQAAGLPVWRSTRCAAGRVLAHAGDVLPGAGALTPVQARIAMQLALLDGQAAPTPPG
ncbi:asparaginase [Xenophilus arseniciresistens]|uniref:Asparaginase n=1 Tax=Xenophilus arseniciresistens TaxID=1283306 RepID=A0AAE3SYS9_9BURK|nr:asparaginase [Xenophilus arseniciresistens]MDA7415116.1 asparaginase [Xenophilus arseniciresistens]